MSGGVACKCEKPGAHLSPEAKRLWRIKHWRVYQLNCNYSAFNGYHRTYSDYSAVQCIQCRAMWRTKAEYVNYLKGAGLS